MVASGNLRMACPAASQQPPGNADDTTPATPTTGAHGEGSAGESRRVDIDSVTTSVRASSAGGVSVRHPRSAGLHDNGRR
uniref:Uncharacterized protein n=1 Tax=Oryza punctata TaxID=4537 RepID=A0A0E0KUI8_ORYPU